MLYIIIGVIVFIMLMQSDGCKKEVEKEDGLPTQVTGCTNTCAIGYNQKPYPDCNCYIPQITPSDNDGDGIPDTTDPDDDNDGFTDDEEIEHGTDPLNPNDYPGAGVTYTCGQGADVNNCVGTCPPTHPQCSELDFITPMDIYYACACIDDVTQTVHPDWKPDGIYHNPMSNGQPPDDDSGSTFCFDNDFHLGFPSKLEVKSSCEDSFGTYWDYCDGDLIHDWFCDGNDCSDALGQSCITFVPGSTCIDGACYRPPTEEEICADRYPSKHTAPLSVTGTGWGCPNYADSWCVTNRPPEGYSSAGDDGLCCYWTCHMD